MLAGLYVAYYEDTREMRCVEEPGRVIRERDVEECELNLYELLGLLIHTRRWSSSCWLTVSG